MAAGSGRLAPMLGASCRAWAAGLAPWIPVLLGSAGCASTSLSVTGQGFAHRGHDYTIAAAPAGWKRVEVDGAVLSYRLGEPNSMSLQSRCGKPVTSPQLMARHLVIRVPDWKRVSAGPIAVDGRNGWVQIVDTVQDGASVRLKTVTLVASNCTFDWMLASSSGFDSVEADFDAWWSSFRLGLRYQEIGE